MKKKSIARLCILSVSSVTSLVLLSMIGTVKGSLQKQLFEEIQAGELDNVKGLLRARSRVASIHSTDEMALHHFMMRLMSSFLFFIHVYGW